MKAIKIEESFAGVPLDPVKKLLGLIDFTGSVIKAQTNPPSPLMMEIDILPEAK